MARHGKAPGELPWGWWLKAGSGGLVDEEGRSWNSVQEAFWQGHLGFPPMNVAQEQTELLLRVLTAHDRRFIGEVESRTDLFAGDMMFYRFYMHWLASVGLAAIPAYGGSAYDAGLTDDGRAVMRMLQATRDPDWVDLPVAEVVATTAMAGPSAETGP